MFALLLILQLAARADQSFGAQTPSSLGSNELRIVSLHPSLTENLFALGLGDKIVGTTDYSDYPEAAKKIPRIGGHSFSIEKIISLRPTHIVSISDRLGVSPELAKKAGIKLLRVPLESLEDFVPAIRQLSSEFRVEPTSSAVIKQWQKNWADFKFSESKQRVLLQVQVAPIVVVGQKTFLNTILKKCGAVNAISQTTGYPPLNREAFLKINPDQVVMLLTDMDESTRKSALDLWNNILKNSKISFFDPAVISRVTMRLPSEAKRFCESLQ